MSKVRLRRLTSDYQNLSEYVRANPRVQLVQAIGNPPEKYQLSYQINSLRKDTDPEPIPATQHMVEIVLPRDYPRTPPLCRMLTPVFHPNIAPHAICIGDHWNAGEPLWSMVSRIGEMLAYQSFNVKSPLNGEAARWVEKNMDKVPLDAICMIPDNPPGMSDSASQSVAAPIEAKVIPATPITPATPPASPSPQATSPPAALPHTVTPAFQPTESPKPSAQSPPAQAPQTNSTEFAIVTCPGCKAKFRIRSENRGKQFRCPKCKTAFQ